MMGEKYAGSVGAERLNEETGLENEITERLASLDAGPIELAKFSETLSLEGSFSVSENSFDAAGLLTDNADMTGIVDVFEELNTRNGDDFTMHDSFSEFILPQGKIHENEKNYDPVIDEGPRLVHKSNSTEIYRIKDLGVKIITDETPFEEQNRKLGHELSISKFLSPSTRRRRVVEIKDFNGRPGLWFNWEHGLTLKAWLEQERNRLQYHLLPRSRVSMAVAKTLSDFHDGGVVFNNLSLENILLDCNEGIEVATFIDLSKSGFIDMRPNADKEYTNILRRNDLQMLGKLFTNIFCGENNIISEGKGGIVQGDENEDGSRGKRGKVSLPSESVSIAGEELPPYMQSLISSLFVSNDKVCAEYISPRDVYSDLKTFVEKLNNPNQQYKVYEFPVPNNAQLASGLFYGRQVHMSMMNHFFNTVVHVKLSPLMAMVSGCPGAGKSTLVHQSLHHFRNRCGLTIEGKFHKFSQQDSVLAYAFDSFFAKLTESSNSVFDSMRHRIKDSIGLDSALFEAIPNLLMFLQQGSTKDITPIFGGIMSNRFEHKLCRLINAISSDEHPLILFLDDLQWADQTTLDLLWMLMLDPSITHFGLLGCYRDNEVDDSHPLMDKLRVIQGRGVNLTTIHVGPIERESVNDLVSDALCLPPRLTRPLSSVVYQKAGGVILFVVRFLKSLKEDGLLYFSMTSRRWMWDLVEIKSKRVSDDVVRHTTLQMNVLPAPIKKGLMSAACLGPSFDAAVLKLAIDDGDFDIDSFLETCKDGGFIEEWRRDNDEYRWSHDQIQQAAYDLIPKEQQDIFHFFLGLTLSKKAKSTRKDILFLILDNVNIGIKKFVVDPEDLIQIANLNLQAGNKAISVSSFHSAANYLEVGIGLLDEQSWVSHYDLTIQLYDAALEAYYAIGRFSSFELTAKQPIKHAKCFKDKLNAYINYVRYLTAAERGEEALAICLNVLETLGEKIPRRIGNKTVMEEALIVTNLLQKTMSCDLLGLRLLKDPKKIAISYFLDAVFLCSYESNPVIFALAVCRMMKMSIQCGLCEISAIGFGLYGTLLTGPLGADFEESYKMGRLALKALTKLDAFKLKQRVYAYYYGIIALCKDPLQASCDKLLEAYEAGFLVGDIESSAANLQLYSSLAVWGCGDKIEKAEELIRMHAKRMIQHKQNKACKTILPHLQQALDLMGSDEDAYMTFFGISEDDLLREGIQETVSHPRNAVIFTKRMYLAVLRGDVESFKEEYEMGLLHHNQQVGIRFMGKIMRVFLDGLLGFYFARKRGSDEKKWTDIGEESMKTMAKWAEGSSWNFSNKSLLLEAEYWFLLGDEILASGKYDESISAAKKHKFKNDEGLAAHKAALFHLEHNRKKEALSYFNRSKACYESWGAKGLVEKIDVTIALLMASRLPQLSESIH
mmetsp:Transcript_10680/g.22399  ORF Transcript_10680/g.22399 Transcript_10680/m.22399 type:complete len:1400 (+) Transcript_10680:184-4383(+)